MRGLLFFFSFFSFFHFLIHFFIFPFFHFSIFSFFHFFILKNVSVSFFFFHFSLPDAPLAPYWLPPKTSLFLLKNLDFKARMWVREEGRKKRKKERKCQARLYFWAQLEPTRVRWKVSGSFAPKLTVPCTVVKTTPYAHEPSHALAVTPGPMISHR